ncbi:MAG: glycosyltransferase family 39 protein [Acidimicrobiia bacterium]|nr:glycosyltransferase family 39 protein [Acidimicrobiia bacterium]
MSVPDPNPASSAATPSRRRFSVGGPFTRGEWLALGGIVLGYLVIALLAVRRGPPLGWDEAVYSLRARDFAAGDPWGRYWDSFRAPGLPWVLSLFWGLGGHPTVFRAVVAGFGLLLVLVAWLLARHLFGPRSGLVAAAGVALSPPLLLSATQVWPDVPGAALGLAAVAVFVLASGGERSSWWMLAVVPAVAAATLLRFGAPLPIAVGLLVVAGWRRRMLLRYPGPAIVTALAATAAVVVILTLPGVTGGEASPLAAIAGFEGSSSSGFADYADLAHQVVGPAAVVLALVGVMAGFGWASRGDIDRGALWAAVIGGLATAVALALVLHGEVRYLAPAYPWLWAAGAPGLWRLIALIPGRARSVTVGAIVVALAATVVGLARERNRDAGREYGSTRAAALEIAAEAAGEPCLVVTARLPQVMWYSGCEAAVFNLGEVRWPELSGRAGFMLLVGGFPRQPEGELLAAYRAAAGERVLFLEGRRPAEVYLLEGDPAGG